MLHGFVGTHDNNGEHLRKSANNEGELMEFYAYLNLCHTATKTNLHLYLSVACIPLLYSCTTLQFQSRCIQSTFTACHCRLPCSCGWRIQSFLHLPLHELLTTITNLLHAHMPCFTVLIYAKPKHYFSDTILHTFQPQYCCMRIVVKLIPQVSQKLMIALKD